MSNIKREHITSIMEKLLFVSTYSENDEDWLIVYAVNTKDIPEGSTNYKTARYIGNVNLTGRFFIKGDNKFLRVLEQTEYTIKLQTQEDTFYRLDQYFKTKDNTIAQIGLEVTKKIEEVINTPYRPRFHPEQHAKIQFF